MRAVFDESPHRFSALKRSVQRSALNTLCFESRKERQAGLGASFSGTRLVRPRQSEKVHVHACYTILVVIQIVRPQLSKESTVSSLQCFAVEVSESALIIVSVVY
jgi:hypothetical protein